MDMDMDMYRYTLHGEKYITMHVLNHNSPQKHECKKTDNLCITMPKPANGRQGLAGGS